MGSLILETATYECFLNLKAFPDTLELMFLRFSNVGLELEKKKINFGFPV